MPHLVFIGIDDNFKNRLLLHPERIVASWWGFLGFLLTVSTVNNYINDLAPRYTGVLKHLPWYATFGASVFLFASGVLIVMACFRRSDSKAWRIERLGWILGGGGWFIYGLALFRFADGSYTSHSIPVFMIALCITRYIALGRTEQKIRYRAGVE